MVAQVARDLGIDRSLLGKWKQDLMADPEHAFPSKGRVKPEDEELRRLRREVEVLRQERDILKNIRVPAHFLLDQKLPGVVRLRCRRGVAVSLLVPCSPLQNMVQGRLRT